jgi:two-component system, NtrC family, nitrogen regulation sensor histidine kinase NtrY
MTLRSRLFALVSLAVVVAVVLVTLTVTASARRSFADMDAQRTAALVAQFRRDFARQGEEIVRALERVAASDSILRVRADVAKSEGGYTPYEEAAPLAAAQGLDFLDLVAADGTILSSAHWPARFGHRNAWAIDRRAAPRSSDDFLQVIETPQGPALGVVAIHSLDEGERRLYLAGGRRLDRQFLQSLVLPPGMVLLLYGDVEPAASRQQLIAASDDVTDAAALEPLVARVRESKRETTETISGGEGNEIVHGMPLAGSDGSVQGVLLVVSTGRELAALVRRIRWSGVGFGALGIALGFILSYLVAARVTRPVEQLAAAARTLADGDWNVRLEGVRAAGEIATLADAFDTMTRQLIDQRERLVQAERVAAWRELARRLAHELKNPLFPLRITLDNLRRAKPLPPAEFDEVFDESVHTLTVGIGNLNTVIGRFSDFAKMPTPEFARVSPNGIVRDAVGLFRSQFDGNPGGAITVSLDLEDDTGTIRGDAEQLGRALQNLLLNAIDAMPDGGQLTVRTHRSAAVVRIDVSDTGQGIAAGERERLFTPYYTTKQHGTGLGLAIVQSIVADHGGKITVDSAPGRGTTFRIELPA